jgi:phosphoribosylformylglycinamidine synthase PurS subunit
LSSHRLEIRVKPRPGLLNPEGKAIHHALGALGWAAVHDVRVGKVIYVDMDADTSDAALVEAEAMCRKLLANPVTEDFEISLVAEEGGVPS